MDGSFSGSCRPRFYRSPKQYHEHMNVIPHHSLVFWICLSALLSVIQIRLCPASEAASSAKPPTVIDADRVVEKDLLVAKGEKLVISPGVTLRFAPGAGIICRGVIEAIGTPGKRIRFSAESREKGWANIALVGPDSAGTVFSWCLFEFGCGRAIRTDSKGGFDGFPGQRVEEDVQGGALFLAGTGAVSITHCCFQGNTAFWAGAMMCRDGSSPSISFCLFRNNSAGEDAGALQCANGSAPTVSASLFTGNSAKYGGALHCLNGSKPVITHCAIMGNKADDLGGAVACWNGSPLLAKNIITGNTAGGKGGGIGAVMNSRPSLTGNVLEENVDTSGMGKGLYARSKQPEKGPVDLSVCADEAPTKKEEMLRMLDGQGVMDLSAQWMQYSP